MAEDKTAPPALPAFPPRLGLANSIWEVVIDNEEEQIEEDDSEDGEFMTEEFQADLAKLEDHWYKQAARLTSYLVSPIHDAAAKGNVQGLEELILNQKEPVDARDNAQNTPLHYAAGAGHVEAVKWLLNNGADINALNLLGDTALHRAVWRRHFEVVRVLCDKGINRHIVNKQGHEAIDLVRDVDIGAEIQSYDPVDEEDIEDRYEYIDEGGEDEDD